MVGGRTLSTPICLLPNKYEKSTVLSGEASGATFFLFFYQWSNALSQQQLLSILG